MAKMLRRSSANRVVAGVCGGLGDYLDIDPVIVRLVAVALALWGGMGMVTYIAAWFIIPEAGRPGMKDRPPLQETPPDGEETNADARGRGNYALGLLLAVLGLLVLLKNYGILRLGFWNLWPLLLIAAGIALIVKRR